MIVVGHDRFETFVFQPVRVKILLVENAKSYISLIQQTTGRTSGVSPSWITAHFVRLTSYNLLLLRGSAYHFISHRYKSS